MATTEIRGIKVLKKGGVEISYVYHDTITYDNQEHEIPRERKEKIFADPKGTFFDSLNILRAHLLAITEMPTKITIDGKYLKSRTGVNDPTLERYRVNEVIISGDLEDEAVVIKGLRKNSRGKEVAFKTEKTNLYNESEYQFSGNLQEDVQSLKDEAEALLGGNFTPSGFQMQLQLN